MNMALLILILLCLIINTIDSSNLYQYEIKEPIKPLWNQKITDIPAQTNMDVQFDIKLKSNAFDRPTSEIDNIFQIGDGNTYYPAAFINMTQKQLFFRLATDSYVNVTYNDKLRTSYLYHVNIQKTATNWKVIINNKVIYDQRTKAHLDFPVSRPLYMSPAMYNPARVTISNFKVITSDKQIISAKTTNQGTDKQKSVIVFSDDEENQIEDIDEESESEDEAIEVAPVVSEDHMHCGFNGSFKPEQNVIIDAININHYLYVAFIVKFYRNPTLSPDNIWDDGVVDNEWDESSEKKEEELLNIIHVGDSELKAYPSIYLKDSTNMLIFKFAYPSVYLKDSTNSLTKYFIKKGKSYNIEMYKTDKRFQISVNKEIIFDTSTNNIYAYQRRNILNQPVYFSNPWNPSANVQISNFMIKSSANNITKGEELKNYAYPYCLRLHDRDGGLFNGIYYPNGTYNDHFMFTKQYLPSINRPFIHLFYFERSWRIYTALYNHTDNINDPQTWFLKCDMDTFNVLACNNRFHGQYNSGKTKHSIVYGYCDELTKTPPPTVEPTPEPTPEPTLKPTVEPTTSKPVNIKHDDSGTDILTWKTCCVVFGILWSFFIVFVLVVMYKTDCFRNKEMAPFIYFPGNQKYYQTNLESAGEETDNY